MALRRLESGLKSKAGGIKKPRKPLRKPDVPDPMEGVDIPDDATSGEQAKIVMSAALKSMHDKREAEAKSMALTTDGAFYFCAVFDTRDQKIAFLRALGMLEDGDIYIDGRKLADKMGIEIPSVEVSMPKLFRVDKKYGAMALKKGER